MTGVDRSGEAPVRRRKSSSRFPAPTIPPRTGATARTTNDWSSTTGVGGASPVWEAHRSAIPLRTPRGGFCQSSRNTPRRPTVSGGDLWSIQSGRWCSSPDCATLGLSHGMSLGSEGRTSCGTYQQNSRLTSLGFDHGKCAGGRLVTPCFRGSSPSCHDDRSEMELRKGQAAVGTSRGTQPKRSARHRRKKSRRACTSASPRLKSTSE